MLLVSLGVEIFVNSELCIGLLMGEYVVVIVKQMGIKCVDQDELVVVSYCNMVDVYDWGFFDDLVSLFLGLY